MSTRRRSGGQLRLVGAVLRLGAVYAFGFALFHGPTHLVLFGGQDGFVVRGWKLMLGAVAVLVGVGALPAVGRAPGWRERLLALAVVGACAAVIAYALVTSSTATSARLGG